MTPVVAMSLFFFVTVFYIKNWLPKNWSQKQISAVQLLERDLNPPQKLRRNSAETLQKPQKQTPQKHPQKPRRNPRRNKPQKQNPDQFFI